MELYVLTGLGREVIPGLQRMGRLQEANVLEYLGRAGGATVEQMASTMRLDREAALKMLQSMVSSRWAWRKETKLTAF